MEHFEDKYKVPQDWPFDNARALFAKPTVAEPTERDFRWEQPDVEGLVKYLVQDKGFNKDRVWGGAGRLQKVLKTSTQDGLLFIYSLLKLN